jgi:hypothetical protein
VVKIDREGLEMFAASLKRKKDDYTDYES